MTFPATIPTATVTTEAGVAIPVGYDFRHSHHTDRTVGYDVVRTIDTDGRVLTTTGEARIVAQYDATPGNGRYGDAIEHARTLRDGKGWALACARYACGCHEAANHGVGRVA